MVGPDRWQALRQVARGLAATRQGRIDHYEQRVLDETRQRDRGTSACGIGRTESRLQEEHRAQILACRAQLHTLHFVSMRRKVACRHAAGVRMWSPRPSLTGTWPKTAPAR